VEVVDPEIVKEKEKEKERLGKYLKRTNRRINGEYLLFYSKLL